MARTKNEIKCPLCEGKTIRGSRTAGRTMYKCTGCTLTWATPKDHIPDISKKVHK